MREIKFRVWDKNKSKMNYDITGFECSQDIIDGVFIDGEYFNLKNGVLMQYTGLKDKNGVEIYEGDIIDISYDEAIIKNAVIEYHGASFYACTNSDMWELDNYFDIEVIGNIYEDLKESGE